MSAEKPNDTFEAIHNQLDQAGKDKLTALHDNIAAGISNSPLEKLGNSIMGNGG